MGAQERAMRRGTHGSIQRGQSPSNGGGHSRGPKAHAKGAHSQGEKGRAALMLPVHTPAPKSTCLGSQERPTPPSGKPPHWSPSREHPLGRLWAIFTAQQGGHDPDLISKVEKPRPREVWQPREMAQASRAG